MAISAEKARYTFADCLTWDENECIEIIDGKTFMRATPSRIQQEICLEIGRKIGSYMEGKQCKVYPAPFGVRLFAQDGDRPENQFFFLCSFVVGRADDRDMPCGTPS